MEWKRAHHMPFVVLRPYFICNPPSSFSLTFLFFSSQIGWKTSDVKSLISVSIFFSSMAEPSRSQTSTQPSRLQRRRPASLQISPVSTWNVAIPLLSPLASSPTSIDLAAEIKSRTDSRQEQRTEGEKLVFKKWQHPAAPFCYEKAPIKPFFSVPA